MSLPIGKLVRVPLREVWKHEAYDFTQWLQENIEILNETLDLELVSAEREQAAGSFSIDLVAEDEGGMPYVIENQLEKSDHDHLGKLITYLTARAAKGAVWITPYPRAEHIAAMGWLNESANADFYLVKIEAVRIDDSPAAPLLTLIVGPSEEAKESGKAKQELTERHKIRKQWWTTLLSLPTAKSYANATANTSPWLGLSSGVSGCRYWYGVTKSTSSAELYIDKGKGHDETNRLFFDHLVASRTEIDASIGYSVLWQPLDGRRACRVRIEIQGGYASPQEEWTPIQEKIVDAMNKLQHALSQPLKSFSVAKS
ncbi:DUF4268 domain-containing protein [Synechococcus sp. RSCCF101]|uniref:DUF4268 domain-containing protein n=1 Tax=Synechococcus sp. RSCCF101 TaxID=2511069 RepID=UPI0012489796|nr:DUF4268 domain-containing protein [Synechococcus sp. RSCCF101]QEY31183.1 DUF4268 domain-containing protein [Synechococcus sp. RSCCF101]